MANNYRLLSCALLVRTAEERQWLEKYIPLLEEIAWIEDPCAIIQSELQREASELGVLDCYAEMCGRREQAGCEPSLNFKEWNDGRSYLWIYSEDSCDLEPLVCLLRIFLNRFDSEPFSIQWADMCDKPRLDEFGGGAVVVSKTRIEWMTTLDWVQETLRKVGHG